MGTRTQKLAMPEDFLNSTLQEVDANHLESIVSTISILRYKRTIATELSIRVITRKDSGLNGHAFRLHNHELIDRSTLVGAYSNDSSQGLGAFLKDKRARFWLAACLHGLILLILSSLIFSSTVELFGIDFSAAIFAAYKYLITLLAIGFALLCSVAALFLARNRAIHPRTRFVLIFASTGMLIEIAILLRLVFISFWGHYGS